MPTKIEWCTETWNPITGCSPISEGGEHCYAARMVKRLAGRCGYDKDEPFKVTWHEDQLAKPYFWKKPRMIFVCSMGDLFHEDVPDEWVAKVFQVMVSSPRHTFLILTKRPERMKKFILGKISVPNADFFIKWEGVPKSDIFKNIWLGVTAENQQRADERIPVLLETPAAKRFVSIEPMLGPVDLNNILVPSEWQPDPSICLIPWYRFDALNAINDDHAIVSKNQLDWVICGGETGPGSRPMHPDWVRDLRDQCIQAEVPFFFKSWGDWRAVIPQNGDQPYQTTPGITGVNGNVAQVVKSHPEDQEGICMERVGKKKAGRVLDGRTWDQYPGGAQ